MAKAPQVKIDIAAVDQFSAMLLKFRRDLKASGDAAALMNAKTGGIGVPELNLGGAGKQLGAFHAQATRQIGSLSRMIPGLGALGGIASVAGVGEMVTRYAGLGVELKNVAQVAGTTAAGMDSMRGSARMLGLSAGTADQVMTGLNKTLADAFYGKNADAAAAFRQAGIGLQGLAGGAAKAEEKLPAIADFVQRLMKSDPRAAITFVDKLGLGPEAINLLGVGAERLTALRQEAAQLAGITDDGQKSAEEYAAGLGRIGIASDRVGRTIGTALAPVLTPMLKDLADWVGKHNTDIADAFTGIGRGIQQVPWKQVGTDIERIGSIAKAAAGSVHDLFDVIDWINKKGQPLADVLNWATGAGKAGSGPDPAAGFDRDAFLKLSPAEQQTYLNDAGARPGLNRRAMPDRYPGGGGGAGGQTGAFGPSGNPSDPRGIRNNNPLNLSYVPGQQGVVGSDGRFGKYGSMEDGVAAAHRQLQRYQDRGLTTVGAMIGRWAPPNENDTAGYVRSVAKRMGIDPSAPVDLRNVDQAAAMIGGMARVETGRELDASVVRRGVRRSLGVADEEPDLTRGGRVAAPKPEEPDLTRGGRVPQALAPAAPAGGDRSAVHIHLTGDNLPQGIAPQIRTEGNGAELATVRLRYAMPTGG